MLRTLAGTQKALHGFKPPLLDDDDDGMVIELSDSGSELEGY